MRKTKWYKQPSTWAGLAALVGVGSAWAGGEMNNQQAIYGAIVSILGAFFPENRVIRKD